MSKKEDKSEDPISALLTEEEKLQQREEEIKQQKNNVKNAPKNEQREVRKQKVEEVAMETPQDRFRKILQDNGFKVGVESLTEVFFRGDTNSPEWLDYTLNLGHIPAKNREIIVSTYYGKTLDELGIKIESLSVKTKDKDKKELESVSKEKTDELDISKMAEDELKEYIKAEKTRTALAQMSAIRAEAEARANKTTNQNQNQSSTTVMMRQVQRPVIINGAPVTNKDGTILYETVQEPIPNGHSGGGSDLTGIAAIIAAIAPRNNTQSSESSELAKAIASMNQRIEEIQKSGEIQRKEEEIKRLNEKIEKEKEEAKKELERKEESFKERLDRLESERLRDLQELKERFQETINHRRELDEILGGQSAQHKKEMDEIKKRLEHAQSSIERTVVAKGTETADKMAGKVGDIAESIIKPMAEVMKDHYSTVIDTQRKQMGLPLSKDTIPKVSDEELASFAKEE